MLAVIGVFLGIAYGVTKAQGERELTRAYLDVALGVANTEIGMATTLLDLVTNIEDYNRATLVERLSAMEDDAEASLTAITGVEAPSSLLDAAAFYRIAVSSWRSGISDTRAGLLALSSNPLDEAGLVQLANGVTDLRVGDRAYSGFLSALGDIETESGPMPSVAFIPGEDEVLFEPRDLARRMFIAGSIAPVDDIAVSDLRLEPGPVGVRDGLPVLAVTSEQEAAVTISNRGNVDVTGITVRLSLVSNTGELYQSEQEVAGLEATSSTLLTFSDLPVTKGVIYEITATVTRADDDDENDSVKFLFLVNPDG